MGALAVARDVPPGHFVIRFWDYAAAAHSGTQRRRRHAEAVGPRRLYPLPLASLWFEALPEFDGAAANVAAASEDVQLACKGSGLRFESSRRHCRSGLPETVCTRGIQELDGVLVPMPSLPDVPPEDIQASS